MIRMNIYCELVLCQMFGLGLLFFSFFKLDPPWSRGYPCAHFTDEGMER